MFTRHIDQKLSCCQRMIGPNLWNLGHIAKTFRPMHMIRGVMTTLSHCEGRTFGHWYFQPQFIQQKPRIAAGLVNVCVTENRRQTDQVNLGRGSGISDGHGIVDAGVCINDQFHSARYRKQDGMQSGHIPEFPPRIRSFKDLHLRLFTPYQS